MSSFDATPATTTYLLLESMKTFEGVEQRFGSCEKYSVFKLYW